MKIQLGSRPSNTKQLEISHEVTETERTKIRFVSCLEDCGLCSDEYEGVWNGKRRVAIRISGLLCNILSFMEIISTSICVGLSDQEQLLSEIKVMQTLRHTNVVRLLAICTTKVPYYMVTEFLEHGSLLRFLRKDGKRCLSAADVIDVAIQIAGAMIHLASKKIVHNSLAARNVLLGQGNLVKVSHFRKAVMSWDSAPESRAVDLEDVKWKAPEVLESGACSPRSDVWSFGIFLTELITFGCIPYPGWMLQFLKMKLIKVLMFGECKV